MPDFTVHWSKDVFDAASPRDAVLKVLSDVTLHDDVFEVVERGSGVETTVDLAASTNADKLLVVHEDIPKDARDAVEAWLAGEAWSQALRVGDVFMGVMHPAKEYDETEGLKYKCFLSGAYHALPKDGIVCDRETHRILEMPEDRQPLSHKQF